MLKIVLFTTAFSTSICTARRLENLCHSIWFFDFISANAVNGRKTRVGDIRQRLGQRRVILQVKRVYRIVWGGGRQGHIRLVHLIKSTFKAGVPCEEVKSNILRVLCVREVK